MPPYAGFQVSLNVRQQQNLDRFGAASICFEQFFVLRVQSSMKSVFIVQRLHVLPGEHEDVKIIGIYTTMAAALAAVDTVKDQNGFRDNPNLVNPEAEESNAQGFCIDEYDLDMDHWEDGYVTD
jgi:hypothetical protein